MRIVCCNKYYFLNGGTERYLQGLEEALPRRGHELIPFSVAYEGSWESPYSRFFLPPPAGADAKHYKDIRLNLSTALRMAGRSVYSLAARKRLSALLDFTGGAELGYVINVYNYMSPSIVHTFRRRGIPVVVCFGDYHALCACYTFLRDARPCTLCGRGNFLHGLRYRCVKGSLPASALRVASMFVQRWLRLYRGCEAFVVPCQFMRDCLVRGGFPKERIHVIHWPAFPLSPEKRVDDEPRKRRILYFGRVSPEKGLDTLVDAFQLLAPDDPDMELHIAGRSYEGCEEQLQRRIRPEFRKRIKFHGFLQGEALARLVAGSLLSVTPSRWYDNAPLAVYESYMLGTPVLAADIGGLPEQVAPGRTGALFPPGDVGGLAEALASMLADPAGLEAMGSAAREYALGELGLDRHLDSLLELFQSLVASRRRRP